MPDSPEQKPVRQSGCWFKTALFLVFLGAIGIQLYYSVKDTREAARFVLCDNRFKQMGLGMYCYAQSYGSFPPAYLADQQGRPMHSWRVLLLPFCGEDKYYRQFKLDEPWNSPHNRAHADRPVEEDSEGFRYPLIYLCPSDRGLSKYDASQVVLTGPHTAFNGSHPAKFEDFTDGLSNTIIGGEISDSGIHWMEPRDLNVEEMSFKINDKTRIGLRSNHPHHVNVPLGDGSVRGISDSIDPEILKALITIDGGEDIGKFTD
jgi:hypothetical protein